MTDAKLSKRKMDEVVAFVLTNRMGDVQQLLARNGVSTEGMNPAALQVAFLKAVKDSQAFRDDVSGYLSALVQDQASFVSQPQLGFVEEPYLNTVTLADMAKEAAKSSSSGAAAGAAGSTSKTTTGGTFWSSLGGLASTENLNKLFNTGLDTLSNKLKNDSNKSSEERALELERLRLQQLQAQTDLKKVDGQNKKTLPGWGIALIAVGGLVVVGTVIYLAVRKK